MEFRMYKYRLYPSRKQRESLFNTFKTCKEIYNHLLELSIKTYNSKGKTLRKFDYNRYLTGKYPNVHSQVKQNVSDRIYKAFQNFFRRVKDKSCKEKGYPRFKSRIHSIIYPQFGFKFISHRRLHISKIGNIPIVLHRIPKGKVKTLTIKRNRAGQWFAIFACEVNLSTVKHPSAEKVGIDVGLEQFAILSNGETIDNPKLLTKSEKRLKWLQRNLSRTKKGSANRRKARDKVAKQHIRIANQRLNYLHNISHRITRSYSFIAVENLNITGMVHNRHLAKHIYDASWDSFIQMLSYKAVTCGGQLVKINPNMTSKTCSSCKTVVEMPLNNRMFNCPNCGLVLHRDLNAAINILQVGLDEPEFTPVDRSTSASPMEEVSELVETGTIRGNTLSSINSLPLEAPDF